MGKPGGEDGDEQTKVLFTPSKATQDLISRDEKKQVEVGSLDCTSNYPADA